LDSFRLSWEKGKRRRKRYGDEASNRKEATGQHCRRQRVKLRPPRESQYGPRPLSRREGEGAQKCATAQGGIVRENVVSGAIGCRFDLQQHGLWGKEKREKTSKKRRGGRDGKGFASGG